MNDNYDDDDERDQEDGSSWVPPPPPDDDEREDPNPRAAVDEPTRGPLPRPMSEKQSREHRAGVMIGEVIGMIGMSGAWGAFLEAAERERESDATDTKTCPVCGKESQMLFPRQEASGAIKPRAECGKCQGDRNRRSADRMRELVRALKEISLSGDVDPNREREILAQLRELDHSNLDGLVRWCQDARDKADRGGGGKKGGGGGGGFKPRGNSW